LPSIVGFTGTDNRHFAPQKNPAHIAKFSGFV
jgi:hypothetical protein